MKFIVQINFKINDKILLLCILLCILSWRQYTNHLIGKIW